jgi:hypothetical protein
MKVDLELSLLLLLLLLLLPPPPSHVLYIIIFSHSSAGGLIGKIYTAAGDSVEMDKGGICRTTVAMQV